MYICESLKEGKGANRRLNTVQDPAHHHRDRWLLTPVPIDGGPEEGESWEGDEHDVSPDGLRPRHRARHLGDDAPAPESPGSSPYHRGSYLVEPAEESYTGKGAAAAEKAAS